MPPIKKKMKKPKSKLEVAKERFMSEIEWARYLIDNKAWLNRQLNNLIRLAKEERTCKKCGTDLLCPNCNLT